MAHWSAEIWGQVRSLQSVRRGKAEARRDWVGERGFPYKAGGSCFLGPRPLAKAQVEAK